MGRLGGGDIVFGILNLLGYFFPHQVATWDSAKHARENGDALQSVATCGISCRRPSRFAGFP